MQADARNDKPIVQRYLQGGVSLPIEGSAQRRFAASKMHAGLQDAEHGTRAPASDLWVRAAIVPTGLAYPPA